MIHDHRLGQLAIIRFGGGGQHSLDRIGHGLLEALRFVHQLQADLQIGHAVGLNAGLVHIQQQLRRLGLSGRFGFDLGVAMVVTVIGTVRFGVAMVMAVVGAVRLGGRLRSGGRLGQLTLQLDGRIRGRGLGDLAALIARAGQDGFNIAHIKIFAHGIIQKRTAGEINAQIHAHAADLHDQRCDDQHAGNAQEEARMAGESFLHCLCPPSYRV